LRSCAFAIAATRIAIFTNRLIHETSPYLRQHADNPVDWYPWGAGSAAKSARRGQANLAQHRLCACHWCHVMAHEIV
jgi:uncharacterized protein YyaL (SSP411 family)